MAIRDNSLFARLPSVDRMLRRSETLELIARFGRHAVTDAIRAVLAEIRSRAGATPAATDADEFAIAQRVAARLIEDARPSLRAVFNLTGTVLHTNLGRAALPPEAIDAVARAASGACNLEYDLERGIRGDRDHHLEAQLCRLTGAEAATVVNNNAAAVLLVLNTLAMRREVPVSRGELIEIGGSFRLPDIMARAGCRLREVGTTNRTHRRDFEDAIGPKTALVMKVHCSNYAIEGFTAAVAEAELVRLCRERAVPLVVDLGSGALVDLRLLGLPHEPTPMESLKDGADIVTFSGDKLLGGPQAGIIVGREALVARIKRNPLKRALRVDKMTIAALSAVLGLYFDPDRLAQRLPALRVLVKKTEEIRASAVRVCPLVAASLQGIASVQVIDCESQIGSGALPAQRIPSAALSIRPLAGGRGSGTALKRLALAFRNLPVPVIGRAEAGALVMDLRCLEEDDETAFAAQLGELERSARREK
ncbi:MAG: L-seryl-tRNA(Sec) selenium transferase [Betaproteobacteria bacterium]|nr:L-seryl-tRNA(Sec) selenium transferase [Betaproteobacteria bacterium]